MMFLYRTRCSRKRQVRQPLGAEGVVFGNKWMNRLEVQGIGGWLLVYVVLTCLSLFMQFVWCQREYRIFLNVPSVRLGTAVPLTLGLLWCVLYGAGLFRLVCRLWGGVAHVRKMIVVTPFFHLCLPFVHVAALFLTSSRPEFITLSMALGMWEENLYVLSQYYTPQVLGSILVSFVMAAVWYRYFSVSRRVAQRLAEEGMPT